MSYKLIFQSAATEALAALEHTDARRHRKVCRALGRLEINPRHPGLASHQYENFPSDPKDKVWESYVENNTPSAWRIFWMYGPDRYDETGTRVPVITVLAITRHP